MLISGQFDLRIPPPHKKAPPLFPPNLKQGGGLSYVVFILDRRRRVKVVPFTAGGGKFSGFWCMNDVFYKENRWIYMVYSQNFPLRG